MKEQPLKRVGLNGLKTLIDKLERGDASSFVGRDPDGQSARPSNDDYGNPVHFIGLDVEGVDVVAKITEDLNVGIVWVEGHPSASMNEDNEKLHESLDRAKKYFGRTPEEDEYQEWIKKDKEENPETYEIDSPTMWAVVFQGGGDGELALKRAMLFGNLTCTTLRLTALSEYFKSAVANNVMSGHVNPKYGVLNVKALPDYSRYVEIVENALADVPDALAMMAGQSKIMSDMLTKFKLSLLSNGIDMSDLLEDSSGIPFEQISPTQSAAKILYMNKHNTDMAIELLTAVVYQLALDFENTHGDRTTTIPPEVFKQMADILGKQDKDKE